MLHCPGYNATSDEECSGLGECNSTTGVCVCEDNYYGNSCSQFCDTESTCSGHGSCSDSGKCLCAHGYYGDDCANEDKKSNLSESEKIFIGIGVGFFTICAATIGYIIYRRRKMNGYEHIR